MPAMDDCTAGGQWRRDGVYLAAGGSTNCITRRRRASETRRRLERDRGCSDCISEAPAAATAKQYQHQHYHTPLSSLRLLLLLLPCCCC